MQVEMNTHMLLLLDAAECPVPTLRVNAYPLHDRRMDPMMKSFWNIWEDLGPTTVAVSGRKGQAPIPSSEVLLKSRPSDAAASGALQFDAKDSSNGKQDANISKDRRIEARFGAV